MLCLGSLIEMPVQSFFDDETRGQRGRSRPWDEDTAHTTSHKAKRRFDVKAKSEPIDSMRVSENAPDKGETQATLKNA